jgi:hypothetical protein
MLCADNSLLSVWLVRWRLKERPEVFRQGKSLAELEANAKRPTN